MPGFWSHRVVRGWERMRWALLGVVTVLSAAVVYLAFNGAPHTGGDNAGYVTLAYSLLAEGSYTELFDPARNPHTKYPPIFPALLALLMFLGVRTWAGLKMVAAVSTVGAVAATFLWAERRLGAIGGAAVATAVAFSAGVVYYSHWILSDPTFVFFTMAALWALQRADEAGPGDGGADEGAEDSGADEGAPGRTARATGWLAAGVVLTGLAYFTRSAGLPLVVALFLWLGLAKRWKALAASAVALGLPALLWMARAASVDTAQARYGSEFWMVDPYQPALGTVGVGGMVARVFGNLTGYLTRHVPAGIVGPTGPSATLLGVLVVVAGVTGWVMIVRDRRGPAELFFPLYAGLILLWPEVWSGDRFALPLLPLLFAYGAHAVVRFSRRLGPVAPRIAGAVALLAVLLPALGGLGDAIGAARACGPMTRAQGAFACYGGGYADFAEAASWSGANLPEGSAVLSRKPRLFFVLSGVPSRTFPFAADAAAHTQEADAVGARYELMDQIDRLAAAYVGGAIQDAPGSYCSVRAFGQGPGVGTHLLGVLSPDSRARGAAEDDGSIRIEGCPESYVRDGASVESYSPSTRIPLLERLDP